MSATSRRSRCNDRRRSHGGGDSAARAGAPAVMLAFVCTQEVEHLLGRTGDPSDSLEELAREVVVTAEKILRADLFGLEKYLPSFGLELTTAEVHGASDRDDVVRAI